MGLGEAWPQKYLLCFEGLTSGLSSEQKRDKTLQRYWDVFHPKNHGGVSKNCGGFSPSA